MLVNVCLQFINRLNIICYNSRYTTWHYAAFFLLFFLWTLVHVTAVGVLFDLRYDPQAVREINENPLLANYRIPAYIGCDTVSERPFTRSFSCLSFSTHWAQSSRSWTSN